jgi:hypothetical protein
VSIEDVIKGALSDLMTWEELADRVLELEAERDRLKAEIERQKRLDLSGECDRLRARHAALVKLVTKIAQPISCGCNPCTGDCVSQNALQIYLDEIKAECKDALAEEVK